MEYNLIKYYVSSLKSEKDLVLPMASGDAIEKREKNKCKRKNKRRKIRKV